ncbi:cytochrome c [Thiolapillus sp.]
MNRNLLATCILFFVGMPLGSFAGSQEQEMSQMMHHSMMDHADDGRISLGLSAKMKRHQLANMRSHLEAIQGIVGLIGKGDFDTASELAHNRLGLTEDMQKMCNMFENENFRNLGLQFHKSADHLAEVLKTKDANQSLQALSETMGYCVQCHATFRQ